MKRVFALVGALATLAGCQSQNPYAAFGPATVPPPGLQTPPYYPPSVGAATTSAPGTAAAPAATSTRPSVSAEGTLSSTAAGSAFVADPADREPIRVVENPAPAARTAQQRSSTSPAVGPSSAPAGSSPAYNRAPGYVPAPSPTSGQGSSNFRPDRTVTPAGYQQTLGPLVETPADAGQWRAR
jgi:Prokaryotic membrane lipoprotein lipid attachment site